MDVLLLQRRRTTEGGVVLDGQARIPIVQHGEGLAADRGPCTAAHRISAGQKHSRTNDSAGGLGEVELPNAGRSLCLAAALLGDELVRKGHGNRTAGKTTPPFLKLGS